MSTTEHADLEALSAYVDGEAPEWADHVAACEACRASAARLGAVSATLRAPVDPPAPAVRERAVAAALGAAAFEAQRERVAARRRRGPWPQTWALPAAAAVMVAFLGLGGLILASTRSTDDATTFAGPARDATAESGVSAAAPNVPPADLGEITDPSALAMRAGWPTASLGRTDSLPGDAAAQGSARSSEDSGAASGGPSAGAAASIAPPTTTLSQRSGTPATPGTRPCEERARTREPTLGPVTYFATAQRAGAAAYVLGFGDFSRFTLLLLRQSDCGELLRSVGP